MVLWCTKVTCGWASVASISEESETEGRVITIYVIITDFVNIDVVVDPIVDVFVMLSIWFDLTTTL